MRRSGPKRSATRSWSSALDSANVTNHPIFGFPTLTSTSHDVRTNPQQRSTSGSRKIMLAVKYSSDPTATSLQRPSTRWGLTVGLCALITDTLGASVLASSHSLNRFLGGSMQLRRLIFAVMAIGGSDRIDSTCGRHRFGFRRCFRARRQPRRGRHREDLGRTDARRPYGDYRRKRDVPIPGIVTRKVRVQVEKSGVGTSSREVQVDLDKDTQVDLVIGVGVKEDVVVSAASPIVDLKSSEVNFNYKADQIAALPLQRNYSGLFQLIPGVAENNQFAPAGGGSRQDNKYLIDGVDITNPGFGYLSTEVNGLDIAEFNVKRGAITAEFGRATGLRHQRHQQVGHEPVSRHRVRRDASPQLQRQVELSEHRRRDRQDPQHHRSVHWLIQPWRSRDPRSAVLVWIRSVASQAGHRPVQTLLGMSPTGRRPPTNSSAS